MLECEYFTDALGTKFPKRVSSNEIRILVDESFRSINLCYPRVFTSEERNSRIADFKVISAEIKENFNFINSQFLEKPLSMLLIERFSSFLEELLAKKVFLSLIHHDYKVTYWVQE